MAHLRVRLFINVIIITMSDIIISGKAGSGKTGFAHENFGAGTYDIHDDMSIEEIKEYAASHPRAPYRNNRIFITQDEVDTSAGQRRFIIILMPDK